MSEDFTSLPEAWTMEDRIDRMLYLFDHLFYLHRLAIAMLNGDPLRARSSTGLEVLPIWPDAEALHAALGRDAAGIEVKTLSRAAFEADVLGPMHADDCLAVFPDMALDYEILTKAEFSEKLAFLDEVER